LNASEYNNNVDQNNVLTSDAKYKFVIIVIKIMGNNANNNKNVAIKNPKK